jgi:hypothetical protein
MLETGSSEIRNAVSKEPSYEELRLEKEFWFLLKDNLDKWNTDKLKENEKKVLEATKVIIDNVDQLEIFNKKAVYLYLREITGLNTKQVVTNLKRIREKYKFFKQKYEQGEI